MLLGASEPDAQAKVELLPREISVAALLPDQPYLVETSAGRRVVHVEAQTVWEPDIPTRMAEYGPLHYFKFRLPVESYVLLLTRKGLPRHPPVAGVIEAGGTRLETRYSLICLWQISAEEILAEGRAALLPLVPLMDGGPEELEAGARRLRDVEGEQQRREMALHFMMLGSLRYNRRDLLDLIGRTQMIPLEPLRKTDFYQCILDEGREEGREEARRAMLEAVANHFLRLVAKRFPGEPFDEEVKIVGDPDALLQLSGRLDEFPDAETLRRELAAAAAEPRGKD